jgi:hypothetical protein
MQQQPQLPLPPAPLTTSSSSSSTLSSLTQPSSAAAAAMPQYQSSKQHVRHPTHQQHPSYGRQQSRRRASPDRGNTRNDNLRNHSDDDDDDDDEHTRPNPTQSFMPQRTFAVDNANPSTRQQHGVGMGMGITSNVAVHESDNAALIPPHSAFAKSGLDYYPVSTFHLHPPAESVDVWEFVSQKNTKRNTFRKHGISLQVTLR